LAKGSKPHIYFRRAVALGSLHQKARAIGPVFLRVFESPIEVIEWNTDHLGTFSGEIERKLSVRDTLRLKAKRTHELSPKHPLVIASEGSFLPHPAIPFVQANLESLLFVDFERDIEVFAEVLSGDTNHAELQLKVKEDVTPEFLQKVGFPEHGLIVHLKDPARFVRKGIQSGLDLKRAIEDAREMSLRENLDSAVIVATDMRAHMNPMRMKVIERVSEKLVESLLSLCPACETPGFSMTGVERGLPCEECGQATELVRSEIWTCQKCPHLEYRDRADGLRAAPSSDCSICNP